MVMAAAGLLMSVAACSTMTRSTDAVMRIFPKQLVARKQQAIASPAAGTADATQGSWTGASRDVVGMSESELQAAFGSPSYVRHERPASVWQYRRADCIIDMFLYTGGLGEAYRVEHVDMRPAVAGMALSVPQRDACLAALTG